MSDQVQRVVEKAINMIVALVVKEERARAREEIREALGVIHTPRRRKRTAADMTCRVPGCEERSRGPRFKYRCKKHTLRAKAVKKTVK